MQSLRLFCKFRRGGGVGGFIPHPRVRSPLHGQTIFRFLVVIVGRIFQLQIEFAQDNVF